MNKLKNQEKLMYNSFMVLLSEDHNSLVQVIKPAPVEQSLILERENLLKNYARDTWGSIERMISPTTGLPADALRITPDGRLMRTLRTSPSDMAGLIWSTTAALDLGIIDRTKAQSIVRKFLGTYEKLKKFSGLPFNWYNTQSGEKINLWRDSNRRNKHTPFISSVDWGWLAHSLVMLRTSMPEFAEKAQSLLDEMDVTPIFNKEQNLFYGGLYVEGSETKPTGWYIDVLNHEGRMAVFVAVMLGKIPKEALFQLGREEPKIGKGITKDKPPQNVTRSYSGGLLEEFTVPVFIDEAGFLKLFTNGKLTPPDHHAAIKEFISYGQRLHGGKFAFTPCLDPDGIYREHGCPPLAMSEGYPSSSVEAPHGYFLTFPFAPDESLSALQRIYNHQGAYVGGLGFASSVDTSHLEQSVAPGYLAIEQAFILAQIDNLVKNNRMRDYLSLE